MGAWTPTSFGNDAALDLLLKLEQATTADDVKARLIASFDAYAEFESRRLAKTNTITMTAELIEEHIAQFDQNADDIQEFFDRLRSRVGTVIVDDGAHEANEVIASVEIMLAFLANDFARVHEDGAFLMKFNVDVSREDVVQAQKTIETILKNKPLLRASGAKWQRNVKELSAMLT